MFINAYDLSPQSTVNGDVCIVGAGAAGITLARALIGTGYRVILLESGGLDEDPRFQSLNRGKSVGYTDFPLEQSRSRLFGGTTNRWTGWCRPLDDIDFEKRSWVPDSGWPISRSDLEPYYTEAQKLCQIDTYCYDAAAWGESVPALYRAPFVNGDVQTVVWQGSPPTKFGTVYRSDIEQADNVHAYLHASAVELETGDSGRAVERIRVSSPDGPTFYVAARAFVLTAGGIETPRLLLASNRRHAAGLGNEHDVVGRYFMQHPHLMTGRLRLSDEQSADRPFLPAVDRGLTGVRERLLLQRPTQGIKCSYALAPSVLRKERLLNYSVHLSTFDRGVNDLDGYKSLKELVANIRSMRGGIRRYRERHPASDLGRHMKNVALNVDDLARLVYDQMLTRPKRLTLYTQSEQAPNPNSRITLMRERDALGMQRPQMDWQLTLLDKQSIRKAQTIVGQRLKAYGLGELEPDGWLLSDDGDWGPRVFGGFHHLGTARMADDPKKGVVDAQCRVHGVNNLFVSDGSVFPTVGYSNPLLTIVAIALRTASHLNDHVSSYPMPATTGIRRGAAPV